ncbi:MAG: hypothetical protein A2020_08480 [Lentisphaerae bacterium GWF2_45_14]|nr:MAG: hypothetical protein A2020_08480 [Lentisphaerae bacterium GWF2_45_14]
MGKKVILFLACISAFTLFAAEEEKKSTAANLTAIEDLMPNRVEELKNENVSFETTFKFLEGDLPDVLIKNGKKSTKYFLLRVEPMTLTVLCQKKSGFDELITGLKKFDKILLTGKIKKLTAVPRNRKHFSYYFEVENIVLLKKSEDNLDEKEKFLKRRLEEIENRKNNTAPLTPIEK